MKLDRGISLEDCKSMKKPKPEQDFGSLYREYIISIPFYSAPSAVAISFSKFSLDNSAAIKSAVSGSAKCI